MSDKEFRTAALLISLASIFLIIAIPVTLYFQSTSVIEVAPTPPAEPAAAVVAQEERGESELLEMEEPAQPVESTVPDSWPKYIEVIDGCGPHFEGECLRVRSGPGPEYPVVSSLRNGVLLKVEQLVEGEEFDWYQVVFDEWLRYPERVSGEWYVAAPFVREVRDIGPLDMTSDTPTTSKRIIIDRSDQTLTAVSGEEVFLELDISTGIEMTPTPRGEFTIFRKTPSRYMQGPLPYLTISKYYDLPGVPWNLYFTEQGAVIHGAYWHDSFGSQYSSGCVNVNPMQAETLYRWADLGTSVLVRD